MRNAVLLALALLVAGCGGGPDLTEKFGQINEGMTLDQVTEILGEPTSQPMGFDLGGATSVAMYAWEWPGDKAIYANFQGGKLVQKTMSNP